MFNLYHICDQFNGFSPMFLDIVMLFCFIFAVLTTVAKNPVVSVLYLIFLFINIAIYLITIGISFLGISYILVYVGAVSILFLFILMLINIRISELKSESNNSIPLAIFTILIFIIPLLNVLPTNNISYEQLTNFTNIEQIYYVSSNDWDISINDISDIISIGNVMYANYSLWLVITSVILLLAMVGSIVITIKQKF